jgi:hypothetical protein
MPHADVAIVPGSHGGFNRIDELNDRITAFIDGHSRRERGRESLAQARDSRAR